MIGAEERELHPGIVQSGREHQRGAAARLLISHLWVKGDPDEVAALRDVAPRYLASLPALGPASISECRFSGGIGAGRSERL